MKRERLTGRSSRATLRTPIVQSAVEMLEQRSLLSATISGTVYKDITGNGLGSGDTGLSGQTVKLYKDKDGNGKLTSADGGSISTKTTASGGTFSFGGLALGKYLVKTQPASNGVRTHPTMSDTVAINANQHKTYSGVKFATYIKSFNRSAVTSISYLVNGTKTVYSLDDVKQGDIVKVKFKILGTSKVTLSFASYVATNPNGTDIHKQSLFQSKTGSFSPGWNSMTICIPKCYYQVDFVGGPVIDKFGPNGSNIRYGKQSRLIDASYGGTCACTPKPPAPQVDIEKTTSGTPNANQTAANFDNEDEANGAGVPILTPGNSVTWTYHVTNTGTVDIPLANVTVTDSVSGVNPVRTTDFSGDNDAILEPGEVWAYTATGTVANLAGGTYSNTGTVTVVGGNTDSDKSHYKNPTLPPPPPPQPGIRIEKAVNAADPFNPTAAEDADNAPGKFIAPGTSVVWTYQVFNTGDVPLTITEIEDDFGTVSTSDDFNPAPVLSGGFNVGDTDQDGLLDTTEVWNYTSQGVVTHTAGANPDGSFTLSFNDINPNDPNNQPTDISQQLFMDVSAVGANQVLFKFRNAGPTASRIEQINWDDNDANFILSNPSIYAPATTSGVTFVIDTPPGNLPQGNNTFPSFDEDFEAERSGNAADGVDPNESVGVLFTLTAGKTLADVLAALQTGALRIGMHVQSISTSSFSDSVILDPSMPSLQHTNIATVTGKDAAQTEVTDSDPASYYTTPMTM